MQYGLGGLEKSTSHRQTSRPVAAVLFPCQPFINLSGGGTGLLNLGRAAFVTLTNLPYSSNSNDVQNVVKRLSSPSKRRKFRQNVSNNAK